MQEPKHTVKHDGHTCLVAADTKAHRVHVADAATDKVTSALTDVTLCTPAGTVQLGHGRITFMDESKPRLNIVRIDAAGKPAVERHFAIPSLAGKWERAGWLTADASAPRP